MPIDFTCLCGRRFRLQDRLAGKFARCPGCRAVVSIPGPKGADSEAESGDAEEYPPAEAAPEPRRSGTMAPAASNDAAEDQERDRPRKRRKPKKTRASEDNEIHTPEDKAGMGAIYQAQTAGEFMIGAEEMRRKRLRALPRLIDGMTLFGIHFTPSVTVGAVMLVTGLICLSAIGLTHWSAWRFASPGVIFGAIVYTLAGAFLLVRSVIFGQED